MIKNLWLSPPQLQNKTTGINQGYFIKISIIKEENLAFGGATKDVINIQGTGLKGLNQGPILPARARQAYFNPPGGGVNRRRFFSKIFSKG